jgi:hypothetical protein
MEPPMATRLITLALACGLAASTASALTIGYRPRTGDVWIDTHLADINTYGRMDRDYFIDDVVSSFGAPRYFVRDLLVTRGWEPGDVYYACAIAYQLNRPCVDVVRDYGDDRGQGWGVVAQRLGIKPGSAAFHALKGRVGQTGDRFHGRFDKHPAQGAAHATAPGNAAGPAKSHGNGNGNGGEHGPPMSTGEGNGQGQGKGKDKGGKGHGH